MCRKSPRASPVDDGPDERFRLDLNHPCVLDVVLKDAARLRRDLRQLPERLRRVCDASIATFRPRRLVRRIARRLQRQRIQSVAVHAHDRPIVPPSRASRRRRRVREERVPRRRVERRPRRLIAVGAPHQRVHGVTPPRAIAAGARGSL